MNKNLEAISFNRNTETYTLRFLVETTVETTYAMKAFTNQDSMTGKLGISTMTTPHTTSKQVTTVVTQVVSALAAKTIVRTMKLQGAEFSVEDFETVLVLRVA